MNLKSAFFGRISKKEIAGSILLVAICILPFFTFAGTKKIYVDDSASGSEDGSSNHPYKNIGKALKHAKSGTEVRVANGTYNEDFEIPSGVKVFGNKKEEVIIKGDKNESVVTMNNKTTLYGVTVKGGEVGVLVDGGDKATIDNCIVKDNRKEGILVESGPTSSKYQVTINNSFISNNGKNGIFSEKRKLSIEDNKIIGNGGDGIGIMPGSRVWIHSNTIKRNDKSGMRINLDGSEIWTKSNTYRENDREGIEIDSFGGSGRIDINKSKFQNNGKWAIARIQKSGSANIWSGFTVQGNNTFLQSQMGNVSPIIHVN